MRAYAYGLIAILWLASLVAAYSHGVNTTSARWKLDVAERDLRGTAIARAQETGWRAIIDQRTQDAIKTQSAIAADRDAAVRVANGLRDQARKYASTTCPASPSATASTPADDACGVLPDVLAELEQQGRVVAETADRARIAGLTCEQIVDGWRGTEYKAP